MSFHLEYFVSLLCSVVALVLFFANREKSLSPRILSLYLFSISYTVFIYALARYGDFIHFPHLWRTQVVVGMLNPALAFIYVRSVLEQRYGFRRSDILLLALPLLLGLTFAGFYIQPASAKLELIYAALADRSLYLKESEGLLPPGVSLTIRILFTNGLTFAQAVLLYRWHTRTRLQLPDVPQNRSIFRWLVFLTSVILFAVLLSTIQYFFQFFQEEDFYWITSSTVMLSALVSMFYLMFRPQLLYGLHGWSMPSKIRDDDSKPEASSLPKRGVISAEYGDEIRTKLEHYLITDKPFLRHGYTIANMAAELSVPLYQLSAFINQQYGQSFNEFVNSYRVDHIKEVLLKEPGADQYTLEAIGKKAGFNSRGTFIAAVKKKTGLTPSEFLYGKEVGEGDHRP